MVEDIKESIRSTGTGVRLFGSCSLWVLGAEHGPLEKLTAEPCLLLRCVILTKENSTALLGKGRVVTEEMM